MDFIDSKIDDYARSFTTPETEVMQELNRDTFLNKLQPRMLSGHMQGAFLKMISHMIQPKCILEIGTYTGYSAIALSSGLQEGGKLITLEFNEEHETMAKSYFKKAGIEDKIEMHLGKAADIIPTLDQSFDLVFIDADKSNYSLYYDLVFDSVPVGGWIIADNVLWSGKVLEDDDELDEDTLAIKQFNKKVNADDRVENMILPFRDGLLLIRKIK
jgi:predicted O-methyltransferase YrrM